MEYEKIGKDLENYCNKYRIPIEYVFKILEDQKVVPMIRGKATEYSAYLLIKEALNDSEWSVQKLNLNAQSNQDDEDISVTHLRTGIIIKIECKNATRGSFKSGKGCRKAKEPHCTIKCHKSRSNIKLVGTTNDRYPVNTFDIVMTNLSNSIIANATYSEDFELLPNDTVIKLLCDYYGVSNTFEDIFGVMYNDWRFAKSTDLAENEFIPRTPILRLNGNDSWKKISELENTLLEIVREKIRKKKK